ncbi:MAG: hypothetical protein PHX27_01200 [Candidatus ainarchaeum sp.]|nr:hypothetical protein [Candidatus ainarchaeum sp.]
MNDSIKLSSLKISISIARKKDLIELKKDASQFYAPPRISDSKTETIFVARESNSKEKKIVGFVTSSTINEGREVIGRVNLLSTRKGFDCRKIGSRLLGKTNSFFIARGIKRAELISFANKFYAKTNYRERMCDADEFESSIKTLEAKLKRKKVREILLTKERKKRLTLASQNTINKEKWLKRKKRV